MSLNTDLPLLDSASSGKVYEQLAKVLPGFACVFKYQQGGDGLKGVLYLSLEVTDYHLGQASFAVERYQATAAVKGTSREVMACAFALMRDVEQQIITATLAGGVK